MIAPALFWLALFILAYSYVGYPALIAVWAALRPKPVRRADRRPTVTILLAAHNEAERIADRIKNLRALDYPADRLQILIGSDGSTDATVSRARACAAGGVTIVEFATRRGKPATLNDLARRARGEILVLTDARQRFEPDALRALVAPFSDPAVGAVGGELILVPDGAEAPVGKGLGLYWRLEKAIRARESRAGSCVGVSGAIYAVRRDLFDPLPEEVILDDVLVPMRVARRGLRVIFEPRARAYDQLPASEREEFRRKVRTIAGNFQLLARHRWLLDPRRNPLWLQTVSHKGLRLLGPVLLVTMLAASLALARRPVYQLALAAQIGCYAAALVGRFGRSTGRRWGLAALPYAVCLLNWATLVGFVRFAGARQTVTWERGTPENQPATLPFPQHHRPFPIGNSRIRPTVALAAGGYRTRQDQGKAATAGAERGAARSGRRFGAVGATRRT